MDNLAGVTSKLKREEKSLRKRILAIRKVLRGLRLLGGRGSGGKNSKRSIAAKKRWAKIKASQK